VCEAFEYSDDLSTLICQKRQAKKDLERYFFMRRYFEEKLLLMRRDPEALSTPPPPFVAQN